MPTYDYRCNGCEHEFELFQSMKDAVKKKCPECGKLTLERLIGTGAGVIFKGGGFYETDYRSDSYKKDAKADSKPSADGGSCGCGKKSAKDCAADKPAKSADKKPAKKTTSD